MFGNVFAPPTSPSLLSLSWNIWKSLCFEAANHDTEDRPHDAVHQPGGVAGLSIIHTDEMVHTTCIQSYEEEHSFYLNGDSTVKYPFRDYA
jgi:hypothetical protein